MVSKNNKSIELTPVYFRHRHSQNEKWHYGPEDMNWWEHDGLVSQSEANSIIGDLNKVIAQRDKRIHALDGVLIDLAEILGCDVDAGDLIIRAEMLRNSVKTHNRPTEP